MRALIWLIALVPSVPMARASTFSPVSSTLHATAYAQAPLQQDNPADVVNGAVYGQWSQHAYAQAVTGSGTTHGSSDTTASVAPDLISFNTSAYAENIASNYQGGATSTASVVVDLASSTDLTLGAGKSIGLGFLTTLAVKDASGNVVYTYSVPPGTTLPLEDPVLSYSPLSLSAGRYTFIADSLALSTPGQSTITIAPAPEPGCAAALVFVANHLVCRTRRRGII